MRSSPLRPPPWRALLFVAAYAVAAVLLTLALLPASHAGEEGRLDWVVQFGTSGFASSGSGAIGVGADGIYIGGQLFGGLPGQEPLGERDAFLRKYDLQGHELWTRQFGNNEADSASAIAMGHGGVYAAGWTDGPLPGEAHLGQRDAFLRKYDPDGNVVWTRQFGTPPERLPAGGTQATAVAVDETGVYVAGHTPGTLPGQVRNATLFGWPDAFLRKYDPDGNEVWTRQFGTACSGHAHGLAVGPGGVYVVGQTCGAFPGERNLGHADAFLARFGHDGDSLWIRQFGTPRSDVATHLAVNETGVFVVGLTNGALPGQRSHGGDDAFVTRFNMRGDLVWAFQFGTPEDDSCCGIALGPGAIHVAGSTNGAFPDHERSGQIDAFLASVVSSEVDGLSLIGWPLLAGALGLGGVAAAAHLFLRRGRGRRGATGRRAERSGSE